MTIIRDKTHHLSNFRPTKWLNPKEITLDSEIL